MTSAVARKQCSNDSNCTQTTVANCEGCSKAFCPTHFTQHRNLLDEKMNLIMSKHNDLKKMFNHHRSEPYNHPLIQNINSWEKESVAKIQRRAKELRKEVLQLTIANQNELSIKLQQLSDRLKQSRVNGDFIETDLQLWKNSLIELKTNLNSLSTISITQNDDKPIVFNMFIESYRKVNDVFERLSDNSVQILKSGRVAAHDATKNLTEVRGKHEYSSGCYEIHLSIDRFIGEWMFFGINSKSGTLEKISSAPPASACGWSSDNSCWLNGTDQVVGSNPSVELKMDDKICLLVDCDNRQLSMVNQRTKAKHELIVDENFCPFPCQLSIALYDPNSYVRIVNT
ncbi:hypothetical protein I4U23_002928 [Adineta vaga]|nr:hypothetical protein I4U23_002928 [Adineta vaga]